MRGNRMAGGRRCPYDTLTARPTVPPDASQLRHRRPACADLVRRTHRAGPVAASD
ncbi:hypothetical protein [Streptomyces sp. NRRL B-24085]|uniref:hypothetical protein n=1 Tax=Streptomyces sp. NRRL B-24085 TaxID=1709476 RepID=UPI000AA2E2F5|nr:hypothetical protein [Streptomyces sp. NRRL B-24085]